MNSYGMVKNTAIGIKDAIDDFADSYIRALEDLWQMKDKIKEALEYIKESKTIEDDDYFELMRILGEFDDR